MDAAPVVRCGHQDHVGLGYEDNDWVEIELTAHHRGGHERLRDGRVQVEHEVVLGGDPVVPTADLLGDPALEVVADEGVDQVDDPLPREPADVALVGEVVVQDGVLLAGLEELLDREAFVVRYIYLLRLGLLDDYNID